MTFSVSISDTSGPLPGSVGILTAWAMRAIGTSSCRKQRIQLAPRALRMGMSHLLLKLVALGAVAGVVGADARREPPRPRPHATCTLAASGGDDAPAFVKAVRTCDTVIVPKDTTISIGTRVNMTGVSNKHIVSLSIIPVLGKDNQTRPWRTERAGDRQVH